MADEVSPPRSSNRRVTRAMAARERSPEVVYVDTVLKDRKQPTQSSRKRAKGRGLRGPEASGDDVKLVVIKQEESDRPVETKPTEGVDTAMEDDEVVVDDDSPMDAEDTLVERPAVNAMSTEAQAASADTDDYSTEEEDLGEKKPAVRRLQFDDNKENKGRGLQPACRKVLDVVINLLLKSTQHKLSVRAMARDRRVELSEEAIRNVCHTRKQLFVVFQNGDVALNFKNICVCKDYWTDAVHDTYDCEAFHVCPDWVLNEEKRKNGEPVCAKGDECPLEHNLTQEPANREAVKVSGFTGLSEKSAKALLRVVVAKMRNSVNLRLCEEYYINNGKCSSRSPCTSLHLCVSVALPGRFPCPLEDCQMNHDLKDPSCCSIYSAAGISDDIIHRASRKALTAAIAPALLDDPLIAKIKTFKYKSTAEEDGDVQDEHICLFSLDDEGCTLNICHLLHSAPRGINFQWQISNKNRASDADPSWLNLPPAYNEELEDNYCSLRDVEFIESQRVDIPKLRELLDEGERAKYQTVVDVLDLDREYAVAFDDGTGVHKLWPKDFHGVVLLRRLGTPSSAVSDHPDATKYAWYFPDNFERWVKYGEQPADGGAGEQLTRRGVRSDLVEVKFSAGQRTFSFSIGSNAYVIDFTRMKQTNRQTKTKRVVLRRPWRKPKPDASPRFPLPATWALMKKTQLYQLFEVPAGSAEFQEIKAFVDANGGVPTVTNWPARPAGAGITRIVRIQNRFLWQAYQSKKNTMIEAKGVKKTFPAGFDPMANIVSTPPINELRVFHGTHDVHLASIALNGFKWQLVTRHVFGMGAYFATESTYSAFYSDKPHLVLARILVGSAYENTKKSLRAPAAPFDSTFGFISDNTNPKRWKIHVIYNDDMMYPEYIVYF